MAISNPNPQARDIVIYQRDDANTYWGEVHISGSNRIIYVDSSGHVNADDSSSFYTLFPPSSSAGSGGSNLITGSLVPITSSWAITASFAMNGGGSGTTLATGSLVPITSSWAQTSSWAINAINVLQSTSSVSSSFASSSLSASVINILITASNANYYIPFVTTNSFQPVYIDPNSIFYNPATDTLTVNIVSSSFVSASLFGTSSWSNTASFSLNSGTTLNTGSTYPITASVAVSASYSLSSSYSVSSSVARSSSFAQDYPRELTTGSTYPITASWAASSTTASFALNFNPTSTASYAISALNSSTSSYLSASSAISNNGYQVGSGWQVYTTASTYTISQTDDGKQIIINSSSLVAVTLTTSSISPSFACSFVQSGSGKISFVGTGVSVRNRQSFVSSSGQFSVMAVSRLPDGSFLLAGDLGS